MEQDSQGPGYDIDNDHAVPMPQDVPFLTPPGGRGMGLVSTLARSFEYSNLLGRKFQGRSQHVPHRSESQRAPPVVYDGNGKWKYVGESQIHASVYFQHKQTWTPKGAMR